MEIASLSVDDGANIEDTFEFVHWTGNENTNSRERASTRIWKRKNRLNGDIVMTNRAVLKEKELVSRVNLNTYMQETEDNINPLDDTSLSPYFGNNSR